MTFGPHRKKLLSFLQRVKNLKALHENYVIDLSNQALHNLSIERWRNVKARCIQRRVRKYLSCMKVIRLNQVRHEAAKLLQKNLRICMDFKKYLMKYAVTSDTLNALNHRVSHTNKIKNKNPIRMKWYSLNMIKINK